MPNHNDKMNSGQKKKLYILSFRSKPSSRASAVDTNSNRNGASARQTQGKSERKVFLMIYYLLNVKPEVT